MTLPTLQFRSVTVKYRDRIGLVSAVTNVSFDLYPGEIFGLVGESGCGKTTLSLSTLGLLPPGTEVAGEVRFKGANVLTMTSDELRRLRGEGIAMIFQDPLTALDPSFGVGGQIAEAIRVHRDVGRTAAKLSALKLMDLVGIPDAARRYGDPPHRLSGGMRQRVVIAAALSNDPKVVIADEPTTALDTTIQAQILELLLRLRDATGSAILFVTHNLGVVAQVCDRVGVMYAGELVETGPARQLFLAPQHPYTAALIAAIPSTTRSPGTLRAISGEVPDLRDPPAGCRFAPRCAYAFEACSRHPRLELTAANGQLAACWLHQAGPIRLAKPSEVGDLAGDVSDQPSSNSSSGNRAGVGSDDPLIEVRALVKHFPVEGPMRTTKRVRALDSVDLEVRDGEVVALVGESGSGKSTLARCILGLTDPTSGTVLFRGAQIGDRGSRIKSGFSRQVQPIFQDPQSSLDPRWTVGGTIREALDINRLGSDRQRNLRVIELMERVALPRRLLDAYPHQLSGGQCQRVAIAAALASEPSLLIADEPVTALDLSIQAQVLNLLFELQSDLRLSILLITHDLGVVQHISDRVSVMYLGQIVESGPTSIVFGQPRHPYTKALLRAMPAIERVEQRRLQVLDGEIPSAIAPPPGCRFHTRCPIAIERCSIDVPALTRHNGFHLAACHLADSPQLARA